mgnify:CR=1 FL=1
MALTIRSFAGFVLAAGAVVLATVLLAQYWGGLAPCELCLWQRWPWAAAVTIAIVALFAGRAPALPWVAALLAILFAASAALAFYHVGVEQHWFAGPQTCTAGAGSGATTVAELKRQLLGVAPVLCDRIAWSLFGISLAGWNLLASLLMALCCAAVLRRARPPAGDPSPRHGARRGAA